MNLAIIHTNTLQGPRIHTHIHFTVYARTHTQTHTHIIILYETILQNCYFQLVDKHSNRITTFFFYVVLLSRDEMRGRIRHKKRML